WFDLAQAGRLSDGCSASGAGASARSEAIGGAGGAAASGLESDCISLISDLKIRIDLPSDRAASGSFLAPKSSTNTAMTIIQCQGCRPPNSVTSSTSSPSLPVDPVRAERSGGRLPHPPGQRLRLEDTHRRAEAQHKP